VAPTRFPLEFSAVYWLKQNKGGLLFSIYFELLLNAGNFVRLMDNPMQEKGGNMGSIRHDEDSVPAIIGKTRIFIQTTVLILACTIPGYSNIRVLNFDLVMGTDYHPESISRGRTVFDSLAQLLNWSIDQTISPEMFSDSTLKDFDVIIFNNNGGNVFNDEQKQAMENFIQNGGGAIGIHGASFMHKTVGEWPWWEDLIGKLHDRGPDGFRGYLDTMVMQDTSARFTANLPQKWGIDHVEWYRYSRELPDSIHVVATALVQDTLPNYPEYYPATWCQHFDGGRSWYTNIGHYGENFSNTFFIQHVLDGINFAADKNAGGCGRPEPLAIIRSQGNNIFKTTHSAIKDRELNLFFNVLGVKISEIPTNKVPLYRSLLIVVPASEN